MSEQRYKIYLRDWYFNAGLVGFLRLFGETVETVQTKGITVQDNYIEFGAEVLADVDSFVQNYEAKLFTHLFEDDKSRYLEKAEKLLKNYHKEDRGEFKRKTEIDEIFSAGKVFEKLLEVLHCPALKSIASWEDAERFSEKLKASLGRAGEEKEFCDYYLKVYCTKKIADYTKMREFLHSLLKNEQHKENDAVCFGCQNLQRKAKVELDNSLSQVLAFNKDNRNWQWNFGNSNNDFCSLCAMIYLCVPLGLLRKVNDLSCLIEGDDVQKIFDNATQFIKRAGSHNEGNIPSFVQLTNYVTEKEWEASRDNITFIELKLSDVSGGQGTAGYDIYQYYIDGATARFLQENFKKKDGRAIEGLGSITLGDKTVYIKDDLIENIYRQTLSYMHLNRYIGELIRDERSRLPIKKIYDIVSNYIEWRRNDMGQGAKKQSMRSVAYESGRSLSSLFKSEGNNDNNNAYKRIKGIAYTLLQNLKAQDWQQFLQHYVRLHMSFSEKVKANTEKFTYKDKDGQEKEGILNMFDLPNHYIVGNDYQTLERFGYAFVTGLLAYFNSNKD